MRGDQNLTEEHPGADSDDEDEEEVEKTDASEAKDVNEEQEGLFVKSSNHLGYVVFAGFYRGRLQGGYGVRFKYVKFTSRMTFVLY